jgi:hypothetical protein
VSCNGHDITFRKCTTPTHHFWLMANKPVQTRPEQAVAAAAVRRIVVPEPQVHRNLALPRRRHSSGRAHLLCLHLYIIEVAAFMAYACHKVSSFRQLYNEEIVSPTL